MVGVIKAGKILAKTATDYTGTNLTGNDGDINRVLTLANTRLSEKEEIFVQGLKLHSGDYTVNHLSVSSTITFLNAIWNDMKITVVFLS